MKVTKQCSECGGREIYMNTGWVGSHAQSLFPDVTGFFESEPFIEVYVCGDCGHYQLFLQPKTLATVKEKYKRYEWQGPEKPVSA